jgi:IstB-like ATP binding protein
MPGPGCGRRPSPWSRPSPSSTSPPPRSRDPRSTTSPPWSGSGHREPLPDRPRRHRHEPDRGRPRSPRRCRRPPGPLLHRRHPARHDLIICDELGFAPMDDTRAQLLFRFATAASEARSLGIGSHWPFEAWGRFLPEHTTAVSLLDRLLHHCASPHRRQLLPHEASPSLRRCHHSTEERPQAILRHHPRSCPSAPRICGRPTIRIEDVSRESGPSRADFLGGSPDRVQTAHFWEASMDAEAAGVAGEAGTGRATPAFHGEQVARRGRSRPGPWNPPATDSQSCTLVRPRSCTGFLRLARSISRSGRTQGVYDLGEVTRGRFEGGPRLERDVKQAERESAGRTTPGPARTSPAAPRPRAGRPCRPTHHSPVFSDDARRATYPTGRRSPYAPR